MGCAQTAVRRGFHHDSEQFFRMQRAAGGPLGYEGPGNPLASWAMSVDVLSSSVMGTGWARVEPASIATLSSRRRLDEGESDAVVVEFIVLTGADENDMPHPGGSKTPNRALTRTTRHIPEAVKRPNGR